jgi:hypothetical protein
MKTNSVMKKVFLAVAVGNLALSVPVVAQSANVAETKNKIRKFNKLAARLDHYGIQKTYLSGYREGLADQREMDRLQNKFETTANKLQDEMAKEWKQLKDKYDKKEAAATSVDEVNRLNDEHQKAIDLLSAEHKQKMKQLNEINEDIKIVYDARYIHMMEYEYVLKMEDAPYKTKRLQREFNRKFDTYLKENGYAE